MPPCSLSTFFRQCILFRSHLCLLNDSNSSRRPFFQRRLAAKTLKRTIFSISFVDLYLVVMHELLPSRTLTDSLLTFIDFAVRNVFRLVQCIAVCAVASSIVVLPLFSDKKIAAAPAATEPMRESVSATGADMLTLTRFAPCHRRENQRTDTSPTLRRRPLRRRAPGESEPEDDP